jgi:hypothetical protein
MELRHLTMSPLRAVVSHSARDQKLLSGTGVLHHQTIRLRMQRQRLTLKFHILCQLDVQLTCQMKSRMVATDTRVVNGLGEVFCRSFGEAVDHFPG